MKKERKLVLKQILKDVIEHSFDKEVMGGTHGLTWPFQLKPGVEIVSNQQNTAWTKGIRKWDGMKEGCEYLLFIIFQEKGRVTYIHTYTYHISCNMPHDIL